jgi:ABC-type sugar transport system ATPase subunit
MSAGLTISGLRVARAEREILKGIDLVVAPGELCALMGASGSGKTTVLRSVAALQSFDAGSIAIDDVTLRPGGVPPQSRLSPLRRKVGLVF